MHAGLWPWYALGMHADVVCVLATLLRGREFRCSSGKGKYMQSRKPGSRFSPELLSAPKMALAIAASAMALSAWHGPQADAATTIENYTGGIVNYSVTVSGVYDIVAYGADGGAGGNGSYGGSGAEMGGDFTLSSGETLNILVGGTGGPYGDGGNAGGGGGSFVVLQGATSGTPLVIAGGGGGIATGNERDGGVTGTGFPGGGSNGGSSGASGNGGGGGNGSGASAAFSGSGGGGGGGFSGNGGSGSEGLLNGSPSLLGGSGGNSYASGGMIATGGYGHGGFGGGGSGGLDAGGGGGGGGYSGGGGGGYGYSGGGGGSLLKSTLNTIEIAGGNTFTDLQGNGQVDITLLPAANAAPLPPTLSLVMLGGTAMLPLLLLRRRKKHTLQ